ALRVVCAGKIVAYSGDTEWTDALVEAADGADVFICEAYFFAKVVKNHLAYATLCQHRAQLACRRIILTHMSAEMLNQHAREAEAVAGMVQKVCAEPAPLDLAARQGIHLRPRHAGLSCQPVSKTTRAPRASIRQDVRAPSREKRCRGERFIALPPGRLHQRRR